jgi:hypothetical protein
MAIAETITVIDAVARASTKSRTLADTINITDEASRIKTYVPENTGGAGGVALERWDFILDDAGVYHRTKRNVKGQKKVGGNR